METTRSLESCDHGKQAPRNVLRDLPPSQAGTSRHKCPVCAYAFGAAGSGVADPKRRRPGPIDIGNVSSAIQHQVELLNRSRATFPFIPRSAIGGGEGETAPYYLERGHLIRFSFQPPLTREIIDAINAVGHWINQNFIIRLCAVLESHRVIGKEIEMDKALDGYREVDFVRRLRNKFAHGSGRYDPNDPEHGRLREDLLNYFELEASEHPESAGNFPIPIDRVLAPLADGSQQYVRAIGNRGDGGLSPA